MELVAQGLSDAEIGQILHVSRRTVKGHMADIRENLDMVGARRTRLAVYWGCELFRLGLEFYGIIPGGTGH